MKKAQFWAKCLNSFCRRLMILVLKAAIFLSQTDFCIEGVTKLPQSVEDMKFASHLTPVGPHPHFIKA